MGSAVKNFNFGRFPNKIGQNARQRLSALVEAKVKMRLGLHKLAEGREKAGGRVKT